METTRHVTATVYVVNDGAVALHEHPALGVHVPPGGHVDRDELPHEAGRREVREELGLEATLLAREPSARVDAPAGRELPRPRHQMLYDVDVHPDGRVSHQHVDQVFFATVPSRTIDPEGTNEAPPDAWAWYGADDLRADAVDPDTAEIAAEAIAAAD
jgi:8-oxo-dGTP pyrophosphatase MutT (NUDIX family)